MSISETKTDEFDTLLEHFNSLIEPFDGLMAKIADKRFLPRQELREAQEQYKSIKETLNAESKELQHRRMTDLERRFLFRAVEKARTKLHPATNTNPFNSRWFEYLYDARDDLNYMRFELKRYRKKS